MVFLTLMSPTDSALTATSDVDPLHAGLIALALAGVHLAATGLTFLETVPRSKLLSLSSGVSVAYVFVHVLPELSGAGETIQRRAAAVAALENHVYLLALGGFVVYYGLERFVRRSRDRNGDAPTRDGVFWLHIASFAVYNGLIGYLLLHREAPGVGNVLIFAFAMGLHFVVNDYGLREHHEDDYRSVGRWILAGAVIAGWAVGLVPVVDRGLIALLFAFLAGGIVLNVIKEELPADRESRFWPFALGAGAYASLLLSL